MEEHVLFKYNNNWFDRLSGSVLITDQRVVLGSQSWSITEIASAQLVPDRIRSRSGTLTPLASKVLVVGVILGLTSSLLINSRLPVISLDLLTCLGFLLFFAAAGCLAYVGLNNYAEVYRLQLTFKDGRQQMVNIWYADAARAVPRPARRTVAAITQAIAAYQDVGKL